MLVTATEPEPRSFGKQVVVGGLLDHLCARLGPEQVHVVLIGQPGLPRPQTPYQLHLVAKPRALDQLRAAAGRILFSPHSSLQEAALWSGRVLAEVKLRLTDIDADLEVWDTMRTGQYARALGRSRARRVLYADDLFSQRYASMLVRMKSDPSPAANPLGEFSKMLPSGLARIVAQPMVYRPLLQLERRLTARSEDRAPHHFDATLLVNADEARELARRTGSDTVQTLLPLLPEPPQRARRFEGAPTFVFLGGLDFPPNRDGLSWFLRECREEVLAALPGFRLLLVGRGSDRPLSEAAAWGDHVQPLGWVDDLDDVLTSSAALLSPLWTGSGTKIKVLEALARGLPVVATPYGVLGLGVDRRDGCLVGDSPAALADLLVEVADVQRNAELSSAALTSWRSRFAAAVASVAYDDALALGDPGGGTR